MRKTVLALLVALAVADVAWASTGWKAGAAAGDETVASLSPTGGSSSAHAYYHIDSTTAIGSFSAALSSPKVGKLSVLVIPDQNQSTPTPSCEVKVWATTAPGGTAITTSNGLTEIASDTSGDGVQDDRTLNGVSKNRRGLSPFFAPGITLEVVTPAGPGEQCIVFVSGEF